VVVKVLRTVARLMNRGVVVVVVVDWMNPAADDDGGDDDDAIGGVIYVALHPCLLQPCRLVGCLVWVCWWNAKKTTTKKKKRTTSPPTTMGASCRETSTAIGLDPRVSNETIWKIARTYDSFMWNKGVFGYLFESLATR
jgi:hypothetical protein